MDGGKIILNGKTYASNGRPSKEVTMSEWLAMPQSKLTDGIVYYIKDVGGANQYPPLIYSDEEREIGVWRDGKPLYQKVVFVASVSKSGSISLGIANVDKIFLVTGQCYVGATFPYVHGAIPSVSVGGFFNITSQDTTFELRSGNDATDPITNVYLIVQYTKTTDTPGSGIWTTQGSYAHHYSTTEKIVGTWVDGKPLYEKVLSLNGMSINTQTWTSLTNLLPLADIPMVVGKFIVDEYGQSFAINMGIQDPWWSVFIIDAGRTRNYSYLVVHYTKTTD